MSDGEQRFQTLHEIVKAARINLNQNFWDYLIGGTESETTVRRNRQALDSVAFRPRVLRNTSEIDLTTRIFGKALRIPVIVAPVGSLQSFEPGGGATVAQAVEELQAVQAEAQKVDLDAVTPPRYVGGSVQWGQRASNSILLALQAAVGVDDRAAVLDDSQCALVTRWSRLQPATGASAPVKEARS